MALMGSHSADLSSISVAPREHRADALALVFRSMEEPGRSGLVRALLSEADRGRLSLDGLLEARAGNRLKGAVWAQLQAGGTVALWPPEVWPDQPDTLLAELLAAAVDLSLTWPVRLIQALLETDSGPQADKFRRVGFTHLTDLLYLVSEKKAFPSSPPTKESPSARTHDELKFDSYEPSDHERLAQLVQRTYEHTQDCPSLNGIRDVDDVLGGYRSIGEFDPQRWLIARHHGRDVGCVLLADHPTAGQWELVYMGVTPEARGRGWGLEMTRHAQWLARQAGRQRIVLAVDVANEPAIAIYAAAGFVSFDRRSVFLRLLAEAEAQEE
jgi:mycothiol synthase